MKRSIRVTFHSVYASDALNLDLNFTYYSVINGPASVRLTLIQGTAFIFLLSRESTDKSGKGPK